MRYPLPPNSPNTAITNVYGYLLATVNPPGQAIGTITFDSRQVQEGDVPAAVISKFMAPFVHGIAGNTEAK